MHERKRSNITNSHQSTTIKKDTDEEYWSDFSDENFEVEKKEEKESLNLLFHLQLWVQEQSLNFDRFIKQFQNYEDLS